MHSLFNIASPTSQGIMHVPDWGYIQKGLHRNLVDVIKYYRKNPIAVQSNHLLVKILQSITVPQSQNIERYYDNVDTISLNLSMALKLTSSIYKGQLFDGVFYGKGNDEILIANNDDFDLSEANSNWENLVPVRVLRHPRSDLGMNIPDGTNTGTETGLAVISINITMLAVQYRAFRLAEIKATTDSNGEQTESQKSVMMFVHMYVLPNMLFSHLDHAIFNRLSNLEYGAPLGESTKKHSFYLPDYGDKMVYVHNTILNNLYKASKDFSTILRSIPLVTKENADELMELPDTALTRQVLWGLVISRLPELLFLFRVSKEEPNKRNQSEINRIIKYMTSYKSDNLFRTLLPLHVFLEITDDIKEITDIVK